MSESIPQKAVTRTADRLLGEVYPCLGTVPRAACRALFLAVVRTGRTLVRDIARTMYDGSVCMKGLQEKVSGWLERYDFLSAAARWLWREGVPLVSRDTFIALDSSDISKEFGGGGMEGMEMGYDASRGVAAMGHNVLCAAVVTRRRAMPLCMRLLKGRHGLPDAEMRLYDELLDAVAGGVKYHEDGTRYDPGNILDLLEYYAESDRRCRERGVHPTDWAGTQAVEHEVYKEFFEK